MKTKTVLSLLCLLSSLVLGLVSTPAPAQTYPTKPIKFVVPAPPGGPTDVLTRIVTQPLQELWGQPVVVENRPGADLIIGTDYVAKSAPDGYTLLVDLDAALTMHPSAYKKLPYNPIRDFAPITSLATSTVVILAQASLPANSLRELIALAKASPGKYTYGWGTLASRLLIERLSAVAGVKFLNVPFKASAGVAQGMLSGEVDFAVDGLTTYKATLGRLKVFAIFGAARDPAVPNVPTLKELGFQGFEQSPWLGLLAPAGTPTPIIEKINADVVKLLGRKDVVDKLGAMGLQPLPTTSQKFAEMIRTDMELHGKVIRDLGITLD